MKGFLGDFDRNLWFILGIIILQFQYVTTYFLHFI